MRAIKLRGDDIVVGACAVAHEEVVIIATDAGYAKRVRADELAIQARGGTGVRIAKPERKRGVVATVLPSAARIAFVNDDSVTTVAATEIKLQPRDGAVPKVSGVPDDKPVRSVNALAEPLAE